MGVNRTGLKLKSLLLTFSKQQIASWIGGAFDYLVMVFLVQFFGLFYATAIVISGVLGAVVNFLLNRTWTFKATAEAPLGQIFKFSCAAVVSIFLKASGTYLVTQFMHIDYRISRICVDAVVAIGFNFTIQKLWVFRVKHEAKS